MAADLASAIVSAAAQFKTEFVIKISTHNGNEEYSVEQESRNEVFLKYGLTYRCKNAEDYEIAWRTILRTIDAEFKSTLRDRERHGYDHHDFYGGDEDDDILYDIKVVSPESDKPLIEIGLTQEQSLEVDGFKFLAALRLAVPSM